MNWELNKAQPITPQICEAMSVTIALGKITPGSRLPSVREVAADAGVNPNTVQKSFEELERRGLIRSVRSIGWFVNDDISAAKDSVNKLIQLKTKDYIKSMALLGVQSNEVIEIVKEAVHE